MAKQATRQVSIFLNGKQVENSIKAIAAEQRKVNNELAGMIRGTDEYEKKAAELRQLNGILADHRKGLNGIQQGWSLTKAGLDNFVGIAAGAFTVDAVIGYGKELFNTAVKMEALEKKAKIVFAETLPQINEAAKKNATQMGLTTAQYVGAAAAIQDLLVPMGFARKQAAQITTQLVNLSGALSEWTGGQVSATEVSDILAAALTGERERLKQLGIVLQQSDIDARLAEKGQAKLEGTLRQQAEAVATLDLVLEKSQDAQNSYADNADSMTRRSAELSARFTEIKENLAENLIPVFEGLIDVVGFAGRQVDWLSEKFDSPVWKNIGKVLGPIFDPKGAIIRAFITREEQDTISRAPLNVNAPFNPLYAATFGGEATAERPGVPAAPEAKQSEADKKAADAAAKRREQEAKRIQDDLTDLIEKTTELRLDLEAKAQDDELAAAIRGIEKRYDAEIAKALELEKKGVEEATAQRIALEALKQEEIGLAVEADITKAIKENDEIVEKARKEAFKKEMEERAAEADERREFFEEQKKAEDEIKEFTNENLLTEQEAELAQLETHYNTLLDLAKKYGFDTTAIVQAYVNAKNKILAEGNEYEKQSTEALIQLQLAKLAAFGEGAAILSSFFDESSAIGKALFLFEKAAAAASVIINLQKEKAAIFAAARLGTVFDPTGVAALAIATPQVIAANIRAGISLATIAATTIKGVVKQKYEGGYLSVTGEQDGRSYRAKPIAPPSTGLLPNFPVLFTSSATGAPVLASERGQEYFVSAPDLANPAVANYVRMIDNIVSSNTGGRVAQFADGGANPPLPAESDRRAEKAGDNTRLIEQNTAVMQALLTALQRGIIAVIPDGTVIDINERFGKINKVSGGYYG